MAIIIISFQHYSCHRTTILTYTENVSVRGLMLNRNAERNKLERQKWSLKRQKLWEVSKLKYSTRKDSNKKYKWKKPSNNMNKKTPNQEFKTSSKAQSLPI